MPTAVTVTTSTATVIGPPEKDGSFWVREVHTFSDGSQLILDNPRTPQGLNYNARMSARATEMNANAVAQAAAAVA